jgi:predicted transglutaminase-like cysteine proteinase
MFIRYAAPLLITLMLHTASSGAFPSDIFGYEETLQDDIGIFPQWIQALERHLLDDLRDGNCGERKMNRCHLAEWLAFLDQVRTLPRVEQIDRINRFANQKDYVMDIENYGISDYWAIPRQFLFNGGDCEDYTITKLFSLRWLGYPMDEMRIVVLQDTNLRIPHAVLAVSNNKDILILDNQAPQVISHRDIVHYAPVYSLDEQQWWLHTPESHN